MERKIRILDIGLNIAILHIANKLTGGFLVSDTAPTTFGQLIAQCNRDKLVTVWSGASETTIYGDPEVNYAFRAWHDWCHWQSNHDFSESGEEAVLKMQCAHITALFGDTPGTRHWHKILEAEIIGQKQHHKTFGYFPTDQFAFVEAYISNGTNSAPKAAM